MHPARRADDCGEVATEIRSRRRKEAGTLFQNESASGCAAELPLRIAAGFGIFTAMSTLAEIEKAAVKLSPQQKQELMRFLEALSRAESGGHAPRNLSPAERAEDLKRWAASHERGPGLPDSAIGRDSIYD